MRDPRLRAKTPEPRRLRLRARWVPIAILTPMWAVFAILMLVLTGKL
jgi:hypothetical protein